MYLVCLCCLPFGNVFMFCLMARVFLPYGKEMPNGKLFMLVHSPHPKQLSLHASAGKELLGGS
jgi:hypothetical protein